MTAWLAAAARTLERSTGTHPPCSVGHATHPTVIVDVELGGCAAIPDWPGIAPDELYAWTMAVFDGTQSTPAYCPGDSDVSRTIRLHGAWEGFETALVARLLREPGPVLDFGANVGWYTLLAVISGCDVLAVEADPVIAAVLADNALRATVAHALVGADTAPLTLGPQVRLVKADVEGGEPEVVRVLGDLLAAQRIDHLLVEVSPCFGGAWLSMLADLAGYGYVGHTVPTKGFDPVAFAADPVGCTLAAPLVVVDQANVLFSRPGAA